MSIAPGRKHGRRAATGIRRIGLVTVALTLTGVGGGSRAALAQAGSAGSDPWSPTVEWEWWGNQVAPEAQFMNQSPIVIDLDGDGLPELVFVTRGRQDRGYLRALSGVDGSAHMIIDDPRVDLYAFGGLAAGDIDGDCQPEIIGKLRENATHSQKQRVVAVDHSGALKWTSPELFCNTGGWHAGHRRPGRRWRL